MPKKKRLDEVQAVQVVFRVPRGFHDALQAAAAGLGLDLSNLLRMMVAEHVAEYVERGRRAAAALGEARRSAQPAAPAEEQAREGAPGSTLSAQPAAALGEARLAAQPADAAEQQARVGASGLRGKRSVVLDTGAEREGTPEVR